VADWPAAQAAQPLPSPVLHVPADPRADVIGSSPPPDKRQVLPQFKTEEFGKYGAYREAHVAARLAGRPRVQPRSKRTLYTFPVVEDVPVDLIPFNESRVAEFARHLPRLEAEVEYFRFEDELGLIDTGWTDEQVTLALTTLVDIWAQANIRIRMRLREALQRVRLSRKRSLAWVRMRAQKSRLTTGHRYWYYVDYPRGEHPETSFRYARRAKMEQIIGKGFVERLRALDQERQGLFDWIVGWPEERTPWENEHVPGLFPTFYYFFMNGGGERGSVRFRSGDCS
jgi:hypothetical protein